MFDSFENTVARTVAATFGTAVFASICLFAAAGPAVASETPRSAVVSTSDLNLGNSAGRATLDRRISGAAKSVCSVGATELTAKVAEDRCVRAAKAAAQAKTVA